MRLLEDKGFRFVVDEESLLHGSGLSLQEFIIRQQAAGKLICLCSKNQEEDVFAVFDQHPDMLLQRHHLVNWRINCRSKSENLKSLAAELQLGLDSFIFIDDNPVECAEVRANCPEVLTLQLPEQCDRIPTTAPTSSVRYRICCSSNSYRKGDRTPAYSASSWEEIRSYSRLQNWNC
jgi:FkbH-like protein